MPAPTHAPPHRAATLPLLFLLALTCSAPAWSEEPGGQLAFQTNEAQARALDAEAERLRSAGNFADAIEKAKAALAVAPLPDRMFRLGLLYQSACRLPESVEQLTLFEMGACPNPPGPEVASECLIAQHALADPDEIEALCLHREATPATQPQPQETAEDRARRFDAEAERLRKQGDLKHAIEKARVALATAFDPLRLFGLGSLYQAQCSLPEFHEVMNLFVQTDACLHPADSTLGVVCAEAKNRLANEDSLEASCDHKANGSTIDFHRQPKEQKRGGNGEFDLGGKGKGATLFVPGNTHVIGGLTADEVGRIVRRHWNEIKDCYERDLPANPALTGRVIVYFQIGPSGDVIQAIIADTELHNPDVERCMLRNVRWWRFPNPRGHGVVNVRYPFVFRAKE
jgi:tetratricopeptide (TPR) repeat protein